MKPGALAPVVIAAAVCAGLACSATHSQPPIDTTGAPTGEVGGGSESASNDAGIDATVPSDDAGYDANDSGGECSNGTCAGCCTPSSQCLPGSTNAQCGSLGVACFPCGPGQTCTSLVGCM